jgi:aspartyl-tRNA(Asn)/glutamyl-tRNA(Gln) amidotransferase subunit C
MRDGPVPLTTDEVRWVAHLARLDLDDAESATMARHLGAILSYVDQLRDSRTAGVEPLAHPFPLSNVFRDDTPAPSLPALAALANAPQRRDDFFVVPAVLE